MPTAEQLRSRLVEKLKELFQLDQPDLGFGFFRIMHAKAKDVTEFLENDLLKAVEDAFGEASEGQIAEAEAVYQTAIDTARQYGAGDPEDTEPVRQAKAALIAAKDTSKAEGEVYDHLYRFFERYYENGDFEFDTIYVNGSNNLPNQRLEDDQRKVRLIEKDFHRLMWDVEDV